MGYFQVRYDSKVVNYDRKGVIRLATDLNGSNGAVPHVIKLLAVKYISSRVLYRLRCALDIEVISVLC